jgi:hypothetical protein
VRLDPQKRHSGKLGASGEGHQFLSLLLGERFGIPFVVLNEFLFLMVALGPDLLVVGDL